WEGCTCIVCSERRDQDHHWDGCRPCSRCHGKSPVDHVWLEATTAVCPDCNGTSYGAGWALAHGDIVSGDPYCACGLSGQVQHRVCSICGECESRRYLFGEEVWIPEIKQFHKR